MGENGNEDRSEYQQNENAADHEGHSDAVIKRDLENLIPEYLKLRKALSNDDFESAQAYIEVFTEDNFSDIEELRAEFKMISEMLIDRIESEGYEGELFKQYCPMFDGGSNWISDSEEIENPYYGSQMHNCGETVEQMN
jgi:Cu(I)/Ag(I) efflux system membrane fusion protein